MAAAIAIAPYALLVAAATTYTYDDRGQLIEEVTETIAADITAASAELTEGIPETVTIRTAKEARCYRFIPETTGSYVITGTDTVGIDALWHPICCGRDPAHGG